MDAPWNGKFNPGEIFSGRRGRDLREYVTAYLFIAPSVGLILVFGIFPVGFALYVSLHKWRLVRGEFRGLRNYLQSIDNLTYFMLFALGVGALVGTFFLLRKLQVQAQEDNAHPWLLALPATLHAAATLALFRWAYIQLPEVLDIADKIRGVERNRELFVSLLREAFRAETILPAWRLFLGLLIAGIVVGWLATQLWRDPDNFSYQVNFTFIWMALAVGTGLLWVTFSQINAAYATAVETGEDPGIWPQLIMITAGVILLIIGWIIWRNAEKQNSTSAFAFHIIASIILLVGAVLLIIEIPTIVASGDPDLWRGLKVTVFYSLGTVPFQLTFAIFLSVMLFQKLRGSEAYRIIFFLPYVTPAVASAAVFKQLFSNRSTSPANTILKWFGQESQLWLREPTGIFKILAEGVGISIPDWAGGPSLALAVILILSIWTFVGYNTVIYLAGLGNIPGELTDAAEIDGANKWQVFRHITFPLLSPTTYFLSLIAIIGTFKAFNTIWVMRDGAALGTTDPFSVVIFIEFFTKTRYGYASALAFMLFAIILSLTFINNRIQGTRVFYG